MPARILVVDDVPAVRNGLRALLSSYQLEICGEAENGKEVVDQVRELFPDIVVLEHQYAGDGWPSSHDGNSPRRALHQNRSFQHP